MKKDLFINKTENEIKIATTIEDELYFLDAQDDHARVGNIYVGKVMSIQKSIQAAFVDYGTKINGYLPITEKSNVKVGQELVVRVKRDEVGGKGCKLTQDLTLPGKYVALVINKPEIRVSKKIVNKDVRNTLKTLVRDAIAADAEGYVFGAIIRTEAEQIPIELLLSELFDQIEAGRQLMNATEKGNVPRIVFDANDAVCNVIKKNLGEDLNKIIVNDLDLFKKAENLIKTYYPSAISRLSLYTNDYDIFDFYKLSVEINRSENHNIWLNSGAYLVFDRTEALTVIDVNTGKFQGSQGKEESFLEVNLEAAAEIVRQITLRHLRGIVIVDFINMIKPESNEKLMEAFNAELQFYSKGSEVLGLTRLGLMEVRI